MPGARLEFVRTEIERMRLQVARQRKDILLLENASIPTTSAEVLLSRMEATLADLRAERDGLKTEVAPPQRLKRVGGRLW
jgi:hypothetical protein